MAKLIVFAILIAASFTSYSQDLFTVSLSQDSIKTDSIFFKISEIIDARKDNKVIGVVQRGIKNRKHLAGLEKPGVQELQELLERSDLISKEKGIALRITRLSISELTGMWKETSKAELSVDLFIQYKENYYYITSIYATVESRGTDVTRLHSSNISTVMQRALMQFSARPNEVSSMQPLSKEDLMDPGQSFRSIVDMPIVEADKYKDGYYATFEEFIANQPSIPIGCEVELNNSAIVRCNGDEKQMNIYGFAQDNQLYVAFHQEFYPVKKVNQEFLFYGPREMTEKDIEDAYKGMIIPRQLSRRGYNARYKIDLTTGSIRNEMGF
jgi:hypothetical protein